MSKKKSKAQIVATLSALTVEERLIVGLDPLTDRELRMYPPSGTETMKDIGIGATKLDTIVRSWINNAFRAQNAKPALTKGAIKPSITWTALVALC